MDCCKSVNSCINSIINPTNKAGSGKITYAIVAKVGDHARAGTDGIISMKIISDAGKMTESIPLDNAFSNDFEIGTTNFYTISLDDIGTPVLIELSLASSLIGSDSVNLDFVQILVNKESYYFPINKWIADTMQIPESRTITGSKPNCEVIQKFQRDWIEKMKTENPWAEEPEFGLSGHFIFENALNVPKNTQWSEERLIEFIQGSIATQLDKFVLQGKFAGQFENVSEVITELVEPQLIENDWPINEWTVGQWQTDEEFSREQTDGSRPHGVVKVVSDIPDAYTITDTDIIGLLPEGKTLKSEIKAGKLFIVDNSILEDIVCRDFHTCSALLLLYSENGFLRPIAIQLHANRSDNNPVWTPNDDENDWLMAKICFNASNGCIQQVGDHLVLAHLILEPFACAMYRCLPTNHPIYCLLFQHLNTLPSINTLARQALLPYDGILQTFIAIAGNTVFPKKVWATVNFDEFLVLRKLEKRGLMDTETIKEFGYRDDSITYWNTIEKYSKSTIDIFYKTDKDVANDLMLQDWISEAKTHGFKNWTKLNLETFPSELITLKALTEVITAILFHVSIQHISEMNDMVNIYGNVATNSLALRKPVPTKKGVTMQDIMQTLPTRESMAKQMSVAQFLERDPAIPLKLGEYPLKWFTQPEVHAVQDEFVKDLALIKMKIDKRNLTWRVPCTKFLPENVRGRIDK